MFAIPLVLFLGTALNTLNDHPHNYTDVKASIIKQIDHPTISADYKTLNK